MSVNLIKLAVGIKDLEHFQRVQAVRARGGPTVHRTRNFPKRKDELVDGGSMYWIIKGAVSARQVIQDIQEGQYEDGSKCTLIILDSTLIPVRSRVTKAFQGWRYLPQADVPPDQAEAAQTTGVEELPAALRRELEVLCLI